MRREPSHFVAEQIAARHVRVVAQRRLDRKRCLRRASRLDDSLDVQAEIARDLLEAWRIAGQRQDLALRALHARQQLDRVYGQADGAALICQRAGHRLADPPVHVSAEAETAAPIVFVGADLQADVAFLDQVEERQPAVEIAPRDGHHQPQVALDQVLPGSVAVLDEPLESLAL